MYILISIVILLSLTYFYVSKKSMKELSEYTLQAESYIQAIFSNTHYKPDVKVNRAYGIPCFTLIFASRTEKENAEQMGYIKTFKSEIERLCGTIKPRGEAFDADMAVSVNVRSS